MSNVRGIRFFSVVMCCFSMVCLVRGEFQVNTRTPNRQQLPAVATDGDGMFIVVWRSYLQDGDSGGIFAQLVDANGTFVGDEFLVNTTTGDNQTEPAVAMDATGRFMVVWESGDPFYEDIYARRFDANGIAEANDFRVNDVNEGRQQNPEIAMNSSGRCIIVWDSVDQPQAGETSIIGKVFDEQGDPMGGEILVGTDPMTCRYPSAVITESNTAIVTWLGDSGYQSVRRVHFPADGNEPIFNSVKVNSLFDFSSITKPRIACDANDYCCIVWDGHPSNAAEDNVYLRRYHWTHAPMHTEMIVNGTSNGARQNPDVVMMNENEIVVVWQGDSENETEVYGRRLWIDDLDAPDLPGYLGDEFAVNTFLLQEQEKPKIAIDADGEFLAVWESEDQDGSQDGVYAQFGPIARCADFTGEMFVNFPDFAALAAAWLTSDEETDLIESNFTDEEDLDAFCSQWLTYCVSCEKVNLYEDATVNFLDYARLANLWKQTGADLEADITGDGFVDNIDLNSIRAHWLVLCP